MKYEGWRGHFKFFTTNFNSKITAFTSYKELLRRILKSYNCDLRYQQLKNETKIAIVTDIADFEFKDHQGGRIRKNH